METNNCILECKHCGYCNHDYSFLDDYNFEEIDDLSWLIGFEEEEDEYSDVAKYFGMENGYCGII